MTPTINVSALLNVKGFKVTGCKLENNAVLIDLDRDRRYRPVCRSCGQKAKAIHGHHQLTVRDLGWAGFPTLLRFERVRVRCKSCDGIRPEKISWLAPNPRYTRRFAYQVARFCLAMPISAVAEVADIAWHTARGIMEDVAGLEAPYDVPPKNLRFIGIDEKSWRKGHSYVTVISDLERGRVVWLGRGRSKETIDSFFEWLGEEACSRIEACVMDLAQAYERSARIHCRKATIIFDRYHAVALLLDALNQVRQQVVKDAEFSKRPLVTNKKWLLLSHKANLGSGARAELDELLAINRPLQIAHLLKENFLLVYEFSEYALARRHLNRWIRLARASGLKPFMSFAKEVEKRAEGFANHIKHRLPMGLVEAINGRIQGLIYRAKGFRSLQGFMNVIRFVCSRPANLIGDREVFGSAL